MKKVILLGASYICKPLIEKLSSSGEQFSYTLFPYKDCLPYLQKDISLGLKSDKVDAVYSFNEEFCQKNNISVLMETAITRINFKKKKIFTENKNQYDYDILVIADVPDNFLPDIKGTGKTGVYSVKKLYDAMNIRHATVFCDTVVLETKRLFGLDLAKELLAAKKDTLCVLPEDFILRKILSEAAYQKVLSWLQNKGLQIFSDTSITEVLGDADAKAVRIGAGKIMAGDLVVFDTTEENYRLFKGSELSVYEKITVNENYKVELDGVYAVDRVIKRLNDWVEPFSTEELNLQSQIVAASILAQTFSQESKPSVYEWVWDDLSLIVLGDCFDSQSVGEESFEESTGVYRRLYRQGDRLVGAVLLNCPQDKETYLAKIGADYQQAAALMPKKSDPIQEAGQFSELASVASKTLEALSQLEKETDQGSKG